MNKQKLDFLQNHFILLLKDLPADAKGKWGKMNGQQMAEHVTAFFKISSGRLKVPLVTPREHLPKFKAFLLSEKEFRENTKAPSEVLPDQPLPLRNADMQTAIAKLENSVKEFFNFFSDGPDKKTLHPVFGELNFEEWIQLHYKHVMHHMKQFDLWSDSAV